MTEPRSAVFEGTLPLFEPGADASHTVTARIADRCTGDERYTVTAIKLDIEESR